MIDEKKIAENILNAIGDLNNIASLTHCMTRLRISLHDINKADQNSIKSIKGVMGLVVMENQLQIVLGPKLVGKVAENIQIPQQKTVDEIKPSKKNSINAFFRKISNIFVPLIPAIIASGMVAGITNIAIRSGASQSNIYISILNTLGWGIFAYLAIFVGINAAKEFGLNPSMGGLAGVIIINPAISDIKIYGQNLVPGRGGLIGVLLVVYFMSIIEKNLKKIIPKTIDIIITPPLTLLITGFATYFIIQPFGGFLSDGIIWFFQTMINSGGAVSGFILAGTFLPIVMTGLHQGLIPIQMEFINTLHYNPLLPILSMSGAGQVGAAMAVFLKTKNKSLKEIIEGALPVGIMGIGEPLIFGVTLPLVRPFITACIGGGLGGAYEAATHVSTIAIGVSGLPLAFLIKQGDLVNYLIGTLIAYISGFILTWFTGFKDIEN